MKEQKVIYEKHPVSPERKVELRAEGYKIIDARFAPEGHKQVVEKAEPKPDAKPTRGKKAEEPKPDDKPEGETEA